MYQYQTTNLPAKMFGKKLTLRLKHEEHILVNLAQGFVIALALGDDQVRYAAPQY